MRNYPELFYMYSTDIFIYNSTKRCHLILYIEIVKKVDIENV